MKLRDEYIHGSDQLGVVKSIVSISGNTLKFKRADNSETVVDITIGNLSVNTSGKASTAGTADQVKTSLTFTGGVTGSWNGSSAKTIAIPTKSSWNYDDKYLQLTGGTVTGATTFAQAVNTDILGNSTTTDRFKNARTINGVSFDGTANITITANPNSHTHGNISNGGTITSAAVTPTNTDYILISDTSNNGKIERGITIGTSISTQSQTTKFLREDGTWAAPSYTLNTNTHRPIQVGGTQILGNNTTILNLVQGNNITLTAEKSGDNYTGKVTIAGKANNYQIPQITATSTSQPAFKLGAKGGDETKDMYIYYATSLKNTSGSNGSSITAAKDGIIKNSEGETGTGWKLAKIYNGNVYYYNTNDNTDTKVKLTATDGTATDRYIPFSTTGTSLSSGSAYELFYQADFKYNPGTKLFSIPNITLSNKLIASLGEIDSLTTGNLVVQGTSSIGTVTAGIWNGTRLTSSYIPTDVVYTAASQALTNKTYNGYTLAEACAKGVDTSISANSTSTNLPTTAAVESRIKSLSGIDKVGTVTNVLSGTGISVTGTTTVNPIVNLADNYGDTKNPYASKTRKYFLAAPSNANGVPIFREIVASDIPTLNQNTTGSAATLTTSRNLWGNSFNGSASINGCIDFGDTIGESLKWTSGSWWQRIYITNDSNANTPVFSFQQRPGTGDYVNLLTIRDNGTLDLHKTGSIINLKKQGGIYWDPYIETTTDSSDGASITLQTGTKVGNTTLGTVLTISQQNDSNDTIQFVTSGSSTLYHNSNAIITSGNYTSYISGTDRGGDIDKGVSAYNTLGLAGTDTDAIINRWEEVKNFLKNIAQGSDLASTLAKFVTLDTAQQISGAKTFTQAINGDILGNATTADRFKNSKTISLTGNVTGSATWDASGNLSISTTVSGGSATDNTKVAKAGDKMTGKLIIGNQTTTTAYGTLLDIRTNNNTANSIEWAVSLKNNYSNETNYNLGTGIKFALGDETETNKWGGIGIVGTSAYSDTQKLVFYSGGSEKASLKSDGNFYVSGTVYSNNISLVNTNDSRLSNSRPANGGTSSYSNSLNVVASNEIRFSSDGSGQYDEATDKNVLHINWAWADNAAGYISEYDFMNGHQGFTNIKAAKFITDGSDNTKVVLGDGTTTAISGLAVAFASTVANGVYTNTNQTITGNKTFTGNILIGNNGVGGTIYGNATNGGCNSIKIGDDVTLGDVNAGGIMGMKSTTGNNVGLRFLRSDGTIIGQLQSTNGTLQWFNSSIAYNVYHSGNLPAYPTISSLGLDNRYVRLTENQTIAGNKTFTGNTTFSGSSTTMDSLTAGNLIVQGTSALSTITSGTWQGSVIGSSYLPKATNSAIGCIKLSAAADSSAATLTASTDNTFGSTTAKRNYPVKLDSNGIAYVYIPWVNTTYTVPATNVIPANTTANQILLSTAIRGTAKWGGVYDCTKQLTLSNNGTYKLSADTWTDIVTISSYETGAYAIFVSDTNSSNTNYYSGIMTIRKANTGRLDEIALHSSMATGSDVDIPTRIFLATQQGVLKATAQAPSSGTNTHTLTIKINRII